MKNYFINPELKLSSGILILMMFTFLMASFFIFKVHHDELKKDYVDSLSVVVFKIAEKDPEREKEIVPLLTKEASPGEIDKGRAVLGQYGLTQNLENELFPYLNKTIRKNNLSIIGIFILMALVLFVLNYFQYGYFYRRLRRLTSGAKKVIEGDYDITISENNEGDFSKLAVAFNSMKEAIRNNIFELKKEKQFLADLLSDTSHQLKTPLSSMILYNDILMDRELSREQQKIFLLNAKSQLNRMQWLIQSLMKLARLDAKAIELNKEKQSLNETIQEAVDALESKALSEKVRISFKQGKEVNFSHDSLWLQEAFINIIKNGIEHTPEGGKVHIDLTETLVYRRVTIEDNGEGIREEDLPQIFKRFYRVRTSKKSDSLGIGLALAKSIIEAHDGMIEVQSKLGKGTKFTITFLKY